MPVVVTGGEKKWWPFAHERQHVAGAVVHNAAMISSIQTRAVLVTLLVAMGAASAAAEVCDVEEVLERLQAEALGALSVDEQARAREVLAGFCGGMISESPRRVVGATDPTEEAAPPAAGDVAEAEEPDGTLKVLGVEFQKADEASRGHERLKKKRKLWAPTWQKEMGWTPEAG